MKTLEDHPSTAKKTDRSRVTARRKMASLRIGFQRRQFRVRATATVLAAIFEGSSETQGEPAQIRAKK